ncbi:MAG: type II secretion system F family protein [Phycisphaerales bacterium]
MSAGTFEYRAIDRQGRSRRGTTTARDSTEAFRRLSGAGLTPLAIRASASIGRGRSRVNAKDVAHFTYELAVLLQARIPIGEAMRTIATQERRGRFRDALEAIAARIESGSPIGDALGEHAAVFGAVYIETIRAAETSGNLIKVLEYLSEMLERQLEMRQQLRAAMAYPICVVVVLALAVLFLFGFAVPKFGRMFAERGIALPPLTQAMMAFGDSLWSWWFAYAGVIVGVVVTLRRMRRTERGRRTLDAGLTRVPLLRTILQQLAVARFARVFGLAISSGIGLLDALESAGRASGRAALAEDSARLAAQVRAGGRLSEALGDCAYLPPFARRMLGAGEESAELARMCGLIARHYEREAGGLTKAATTLIEPILIVLVAGVVLVVALAVFLPLWDMAKLVG